MKQNITDRKKGVSLGGFTLLELIVVITIIGLLGTIVVVSTKGILPKARRQTAETTMKNILSAANMMNATTGRYPETIEEMVNPRDENGDRIAGGLEEYPKDPWQNEYLYEIVNGEPQVRCLGADGAEGGENEDADIVRPEQSESGY